jgi:hypothetical protein
MLLHHIIEVLTSVVLAHSQTSYLSLFERLIFAQGLCIAFQSIASAPFPHTTMTLFVNSSYNGGWEEYSVTKVNAIVVDKIWAIYPSF